jgi:hypothetical protein
MRRFHRVLASLATVALVIGVAAPAALAAGPQRTVIDLNDPQIDIDESAWASDMCGFPIRAEVSGHIIVLVFPDGRRRVQTNVYNQKATYTNVATGTSLRLRDIGPDRTYWLDGRLVTAITGRSLTGAGVIGLVIVDVETGEVLFQAGNEVGYFYDGFCAAMAK